ncbi:M12 family metallo-peptidase [Marinilongibacter aquaticus]|uniref:reprolysin-like metallopeptidase n=1 Tax=Marinilongibacter aquaticus TaxID=2975157 RepID=UPI0021BDAF23|nr:M12 family metallo-peptidase [Marinilongibacter aquaticus]UBM57711.1 M12 family metallo-peptidase [Marinilongibacter aquaticus]
MKKSIATIAVLVLFVCSLSAQDQPILLNKALGKPVEINLGQLTSSLQNVSIVQATEVRGNILEIGNTIELPNPKGEGRLIFRVIETPVFSEEKQKDNPDIHSYTGVSANRAYTLKMSITPAGFLAHIRGNAKAYIIEKLNGEYRLYSKGELKDVYECGFEEAFLKEGGSLNRERKERGISSYTSGATLRTMRMAVATTGEFYQRYGSLAAVNAKLNEFLTLINAFYEQELAMTFTLVATNDNIVFSDPNSDPFSPTGSASASGSQSAFSGGTIQGLMPYGNYDIGHTFHYQAPSVGFPAYGYSISGQAGPSPCNDGSKARAWSQYTKGSSISEVPAAAIVGAIVHEMGHQFYAWHTFNGDGGNCVASYGQYFPGSGYEPGSGTTTMSYKGSCGAGYNLTGGDDAYFHAISRKEILDQFGTTVGCASTSATGNSAPVANAGPDYVIPVGTPFVLTGSATDANGDNLTYTWDEFDSPNLNGNDQGALGNNTTGVGGYTAVNSTTAPLFRSRQSTSGQRTFPKLDFILDDGNMPSDVEGEALPLVPRTMKFMLTVRDDNPGIPAVDADEVVVTVVDNGGAFAITSQNGPSFWLYNGSNTVDITWSVAGTNAAPINCANVKISLSTDGGQTFPTVIAASTPNDGLYTYAIPNLSTAAARVKVEAIGNVFFDINNVDITISSSCAPELSNISPSTILTAEEGSPSLDFSMFSFGDQITSLCGSISGSDPTGWLVVENGGFCDYYGNAPQYDELEFFSLNGGSVTFEVVETTGTLYAGLNLFSQSYDPSFSCAGWIASNRYLCGPASVCGSNDDLTANAVQGNNYLMISGFDGGNAGNYSLSFSGSAIYEPVPSSGSSYDYAFLVYNMNNGLIVDFLTEIDLSAYPIASYRIYGISFPGGSDLTPYKSTSFSSFSDMLSNNTICGRLSENFRDVQITPICGQDYVLTSPTDDVANGSVVYEAEGYIQATNEISGGNVRYDATEYVLMNPGFHVAGQAGMVFKAVIDGCGGE